ncbi:phosphonate ABC transporter ATP-binding protein [Pseudomonas schmalbachii]|uniref:Phosphonate ABC transporter ATP-binding protein n=1 Tax=Pseudomonas schmalbachii TaxID=2816993 RepID=A0ABS3TQ80_9PSED|nr:phosphonate ABC transporter ATP-binding protein [Pseudomonas schmalbachii]
MSTVIQVSSLSKTFGSRRMLRDVTFSIGAGERVALLGPSGAGKSTLLRSLSGLTVADRGSDVRLHGRTVQLNGRLHGACRAERCRTGYIFQQFNLVGRLSVLGNVLLGYLGRIPRWRALLGQFSAEERRKAEEALERVGLSGFGAQRANTLSGGQMQRVAIARALVQEADLILADEPIASLDPHSAREVMELLQRICAEDGKTLLVSLHQVDYARRYCQRALALRDGEVLFDGPIAGLGDASLDALYSKPRVSTLTFPNSAPLAIAVGE